MAIEGLKVTLSALFVQEMCLKRATERRHRATLYEQQIKTLGDAGIEMGTASNDVKARANEGVKSCIKEAEEMEFYAKHIDLTETFVLSAYDLQKLGIVK